MTLANADDCFQPNVAKYLNSFCIVSVNCAAYLAVPDVKNIYSYPLVGARKVFFIFVGALFSAPDFFQGFFPYFVILHSLDLIGIILMEHYPCSSTLILDEM